MKKILKYLHSQNYAPIKGSNLHIKFPLHKDVLNQLFVDLAAQKNIIKSIEILKLEESEAEIQISIMPVKIGFKSFELVDRVISCRVLNDFSPPEFKLKLEITDGLRFWEDTLINILFDTILNLEAIHYDDKILSISLAPKEMPQILNYIKNTNLLMEKDQLVYGFDWEV